MQNFYRIRNPAISGAFLTVLGAMLGTVYIYGVSVPFFDEWEAEAGWIYRLYETNSLGIEDLFEPHNGHRVFLTRAVALAFYIINGGWDPQLQMLVNAFLHACICAYLVKFISLRLHGPNISTPLILTVLLFAIPFSWLSILVAFQTQFYFMVLFSLLALSYFSTSRFIRGYIFSGLAMLSMTAGAFVLPAYAGLVAVQAIGNRTIDSVELRNAIICMILFVLFVITLPGEPAAEAYYAHHLRGFIVTILASISWPFRISYGIGLIVYAPLVLFLLMTLLTNRTPRFLVALSIFMVLQILAIGYFRGGEGVPPANRYWELMILGIWTNGMCLAYISNKTKLKRFKHTEIAWTLVLVIGMAMLANQTFREGLPSRKIESETAQSLISEYLESGDRSVFAGKTGFEVSHTDPTALISLLDNPVIRRTLPSSLGNKQSQNRLLPIKSLLFILSPAFFMVGLLFVVLSIKRDRKVRRF